MSLPLYYLTEGLKLEKLNNWHGRGNLHIPEISYNLEGSCVSDFFEISDLMIRTVVLQEIPVRRYAMRFRSEVSLDFFVAGETFITRKLTAIEVLKSSDEIFNSYIRESLIDLIKKMEQEEEII